MTTSHSTELLKNMLVSGGNDFYTRPSKTIGATYRLLFCRLPSLYIRRSCKVDVLIPGIMNIPHLPAARIVRNDGLPVLPFLVLLILKVQGWWDHRNSDRSDYRAKQHQDSSDVDAMLAIGKRRGEDFSLLRTWLSDDFTRHGQKIILEYIAMHGRREMWEVLGFYNL